MPADASDPVSLGGHQGEGARSRLSDPKYTHLLERYSIAIRSREVQEGRMAPDALLILSPDHRVVGWDRKAVEMIGQQPAGQKAAELLPSVFTSSALEMAEKFKGLGGGEFRVADCLLRVYDMGDEIAVRISDHEPPSGENVVAEGALIHDGKRILAVDRTITSILQCPPDKLLTLAPADLLVAESADRAIRNLESGSTEFLSISAYRYSGDVFPSGLAGRSFRLNGRFARFLIVREYRADRKDERTTRPTTPGLGAFASECPEPICLAGSDGTIHELNPAARKLAGDCTRIDDYVDSSSEFDLKAVFEACAENQKWIGPVVIRGCQASGNLHTVTTAFLIDSPGEPLVALTSRRLSEEEMIVRSVLNDGPGVLFATDGDGSATYVNGEFSRITGAVPEDLLGTGWIASVHPDDQEEFRTSWEKCKQSESPVETEYRLRASDGSYRWYSHRCIPVKDPAGKVYRWLGVGIDIHRQKDFVNSLRHHAEELEHFAYASSHDLQEPLRTVMSCAQILERKYNHQFDDEAREILGYITAAARRMRTLLRDLLSYSRLVNDEPSRFQFTEADTALRLAMENLSSSIQDSNAEITHDVLPSVMANPSQLIQLFQNLLSNAINYRSSRPICVHVSAQRRGDDIVFSVKDNGIGIRPEHQERIFGLFKRLHGREHAGTGVGLTIARKIVERHGGRIWVTSVFGHGATFHFSMRSADAI